MPIDIFFVLAVGLSLSPLLAVCLEFIAPRFERLFDAGCARRFDWQCLPDSINPADQLRVQLYPDLDALFHAANVYTQFAASIHEYLIIVTAHTY